MPADQNVTLKANVACGIYASSVSSAANACLVKVTANVIPGGTFSDGEATATCGPCSAYFGVAFTKNY
jgi:hypothetical protein